MFIPNTLTPLSKSVVLASAWAAHRQHLASLGLDAPPSPDGDSDQSWDNKALAELTIALWAQPPKKVAHLFAVPAGTAIPSPKSGKVAKAARQLVAELGEGRASLRNWATETQDMIWSQAELLLVMEEIEPYVCEALYDVQQLAVACIGSYSQLLALLANSRELKSGPLYLELMGGLSTPEMAEIESMASASDLRQWQQQVGHRSELSIELATPRISEISLDNLTYFKIENGVWNPTQARKRRKQATSAVIEQAGLLHRSHMRKAIVLAQDGLVAHANALDVLDHVLAAVRRWSLAAAEDALRSGLIDSIDEIFWLELEELKQVMTGEWHDRAQVQPLIQQRRVLPGQSQIPYPKTEALGVAGQRVQAMLHEYSKPDDVGEPGPRTIAMVKDTDILWTALFLNTAGVVATQGDYLGHTARAARAGGVPAVVAAPMRVQVEQHREIALDPPDNRVNYPI